MPRLMLCPPSGQRRRMISFPASLSDITPPSSNKLSASDNIFQESFTTPPPLSCAKRPRIERAISQPNAKLDTSSFDAIDIIDLTGEADPYDLPRPQNRDAVSFQDCGVKRGKKRKTDECTPTSLGRCQPPSAESLANVNSSLLSRSILAKPSATPSLHGPPEDIEPFTLMIVNKDNDDSSSDAWLDIDSISLDTGLDTSPISPRSNSRGDGGKKATRQSNSKLYSEEDAQPPPRLARNSNPSLPQNPESIVITRVSSIQQVEDPFMNFMAIDPDAVAQLMSILKEKLHNKAEIIYQQAIEGTPAPDLIAANKVLVSQIQTLESLQTSIVAYESCATHKEDLKQRLVHAISEGSDPTTMPELVRSQDLEVEMRKIAVQACELLLRTGIFDVACEFGIDNLSTWLRKYHVLP